MNYLIDCANNSKYHELPFAVMLKWNALQLCNVFLTQFCLFFKCSVTKFINTANNTVSPTEAACFFFLLGWFSKSTRMTVDDGAPIKKYASMGSP